jgi:hypothetical protein
MYIYIQSMIQDFLRTNLTEHFQNQFYIYSLFKVKKEILNI